MNTPIRICIAAATALLAFIAGRVCYLVGGRVQQNIDAHEPTMFLGRFRLDGALGYLVPIGCGLMALLFLGCAIRIFLAKGRANA